jgi:hypothetical protein
MTTYKFAGTDIDPDIQVKCHEQNSSQDREKLLLNLKPKHQELDQLRPKRHSQKAS